MPETTREGLINGGWKSLDYGPGCCVVNAKGSEHSVWSDTGCVVLIQWDRPVSILGET